VGSGDKKAIETGLTMENEKRKMEMRVVGHEDAPWKKADVGGKNVAPAK
jgi:hypothetical protein